MNQIFFDKYYNTFMYISISLTIFLIFLSIYHLIDKNKLSIQENNNLKKITGYIVKGNFSENKDKLKNQTDLKGEIYLENSYFIYYSILIFLVFCLFILTIIFLFPKIKNLT